MRPVPFILPLVLAACSQEAAPTIANDAAERPMAPGPEAPLPVPGLSPSATPAAETDMIPAAFRGEWNRVAADCGTSRNDSRLRIDAKRIRFHESSGDVLAVRGEGAAIAVRARYSGEGETWEDERRFTLSADGKMLSADGMDRVRCP